MRRRVRWFLPRWRLIRHAADRPTSADVRDSSGGTHIQAAAGQHTDEASPRRSAVLAGIDRPFSLAVTATLGVLLSLLLGLAVTSLSTVLAYITLALFISLGLDPVVRALEHRGIARGGGIALVFAVFAILVVGFAVLILPVVVQQVFEFARAVPGAIAALRESSWFGWMTSENSVSLETAAVDLRNALSDPELILSVGGGLLSAGVGVVAGVSGSFIVIVLTLYFLASLPAMKASLYLLAPARNRAKLADLTERVTASVGTSILGSVALAAINSVVVLLLCLVIGIPFPWLLMVLAFVVTLVPLFGSVLFWVIGTAIALIVSPTQGLIFAIAYFVYIQLEAYVITPRVMTRAVAVPAALVLLGAMIGGTLMGVLGVLVAIPVVASILLIVREVVVPRQNEKT